MFIALHGSNKIDVCDIDTFAQKRGIILEERTGEIVADEKVIYVREWLPETILRIELPEGTRSRWPVKDRHFKMSVTREGNVVVNYHYINKIIEYTSIGNIVREIKVGAVDITFQGPNHTIKTNDDQFIVCLTSEEGSRVCLFNNESKLLKSYGKGRGSGMGQLDLPVYLAIDQNGFIFVADYNNHRIVQLNSSLEYVSELELKSAGLTSPSKIMLHEKKKFMLIVASDGKSEMKCVYKFSHE